MPLYEYHCEECNKDFEIMQGINDKTLTKCPSCGGTLRKLISLSSFTLKGSGWYKTDYNNKKTQTSDCSTCCSQETCSQ